MLCELCVKLCALCGKKQFNHKEHEEKHKEYKVEKNLCEYHCVLCGKIKNFVFSQYKIKIHDRKRNIK